MKKIVLFAAAGLMSLAACQEKAGYIIKGTAEGVADGDTVFLQKQTEEGFEALDSVVVKNGTFEFKGTPDSVAVISFRNLHEGRCPYGCHGVCRKRKHSGKSEPDGKPYFRNT